MKVILITGVAGFIGNQLFRFLKRKKIKVFGTINKNRI
jgi:nucleoside-diphosphate-sugar epimerase